jgi:hypothetical protein
MKKIIVNVPKNPSPLKAIRRHCVECGGGTRIDVEKCNVVGCALHPFRFGMMPETYIARNPDKIVKKHH